VPYSSRGPPPPPPPLLPYTTLFRSVHPRLPLQLLGHRVDVVLLVEEEPGRLGEDEPLDLGHGLGPGFGIDDRRSLGEHLIDALRSEEHTSELQSRENLVCRLLLEKK